MIYYFFIYLFISKDLIKFWFIYRLLKLDNILKIFPLFNFFVYSEKWLKNDLVVSHSIHYYLIIKIKFNIFWLFIKLWLLIMNDDSSIHQSLLENLFVFVVFFIIRFFFDQSAQFDNRLHKCPKDQKPLRGLFLAWKDKTSLSDKEMSDLFLVGLNYSSDKIRKI